MSSVPPLFCIYNTILDMMEARNFIVRTPRHTMEEYVDDFCLVENGQYLVDRERLTLSLVHKYEREKTIRIFFLEPANQKTGKKQLEQWLTKMGETRTRALFVVPEGAEFTSHAMKIMDNANRETRNVFLECFSEKQVSVNLVGVGKLYREYRVLSENEARAVMEKYGNKIPAIGYDDVIARYFGMQHNDVLALNRSSESAGMYTKFMKCLYVEQMPKESKVKVVKK